MTYDVTDVSGGKVSGSRIILDPEDTTSIFCLDGVVNAPEELGRIDVYAKTDDECIETDYCQLHRQSEEEGINRFSLNIQRRFMAQSQIVLFAYSEKTGETYILETFEVTYDG